MRFHDYSKKTTYNPKKKQNVKQAEAQTRLQTSMTPFPSLEQSLLDGSSVLVRKRRPKNAYGTFGPSISGRPMLSPCKKYTADIKLKMRGLWLAGEKLPPNRKGIEYYSIWKTFPHFVHLILRFSVPLT
jgi:hypothetical protein